MKTKSGTKFCRNIDWVRVTKKYISQKLLEQHKIHYETMDRMWPNNKGRPPKHTNQATGDRKELQNRKYWYCKVPFAQGSMMIAASCCNGCIHPQDLGNKIEFEK